MFSSPTKFTALVVGLASIAIAVPADVPDHKLTPERNFIVTHDAIDYFPHARGNLSRWDIAVGFTGYNSTMESWLTSLKPSSGATDEEKAKILISAAYAKPFDLTDADMVGDMEALLGAVAGKTDEDIKSIEQRDRHFLVRTAHAVTWATCSALFACLSGATCSFTLDVHNAPRSRCQEQGGENCCISWSSYDVKVGFFKSTWTSCNSAVVDDEHLQKASCEGKADYTGGNVCLSNRANGCT